MEDFNPSPEGKDPKKGSKKKVLLSLGVLGAVALVGVLYLFTPAFGTQGYLRFDSRSFDYSQPLQEFNRYDYEVETPNFELEYFDVGNSRGDSSRGGSKAAEEYCKELAQKLEEAKDNFKKVEASYDEVVYALSVEKNEEMSNAQDQKTKKYYKNYWNVQLALENMQAAKGDLDKADAELKAAKAKVAKTSYTYNPNVDQSQEAAAFEAAKKDRDAKIEAYNIAYAAWKEAAEEANKFMKAHNADVEESYKEYADTVNAIDEKYEKLKNAEYEKYLAAKKLMKDAQTASDNCTY